MKWYLEAANQGNPVAQYRMGELYHYGFGVDKNYEEEMKWYLKAANQVLLMLSIIWESCIVLVLVLNKTIKKH